MKSFFFNIVFLSFVLGATAQNNADDILGYYLTIDPFSDAVTQVKIYKASNGTYEGVVCWAKDEERKKYEGSVFLKNLSFNAKTNEWENGVAIYPGKKGTYKAFLKFEPNGKLKVRGYWGVSLMGKTVYWTRENEKR